MYRLLSSSLSSITTCDQLNGETLGAKAYVAKLNEYTEPKVTELTSSMVDESAFPILKRQRSHGITMVSSKRKLIFDIQVNLY